MQLIQLALQKDLLGLGHGGKGVQDALVGASGQQAALDTQFLDGLLEAKSIDAHPDGADEAGLVHMNGLRRHGHIVATRGAEIRDHGMYRDGRVLLPEAAHFVIDLARLHRAAAGAIDAQDDALGVLVLVSLVQGVDNILGAGLGTRGDDPLDIDDGGVLLGWGQAIDEFVLPQGPQEDKEIGKGQQFEEDAPAPAPFLLPQAVRNDPFQQGLFPARLSRPRALGRTLLPKFQVHGVFTCSY